MRTFDTNIQAALDAGRVIKRELIELRLGGGTLRFVKDDEPRTWSSETWQPGGFVSISNIKRSTGLSAASFTLTLSASPEDNLTPAELQSYYSYDWNDRKVIARDLYINADTGAVIDAEPLVQGYIDRAKWRKSTEDGATIGCQCFDRSLDFSRKNGRQATVADQQGRLSTDKGMEHAALVGEQTFWWGRKGKN